MLFLLFLANIDCKRALDNPEPTPSTYPLSVSTRIMDISGKKTCIPIDPDCPITNFSSPTTYRCGQTCWSDSGDTTFSYTFKGVQFLVYGNKSSEYRSFELYFDNRKLTTISEYQEEVEDFALLYTSRVYPYGEHTIKVKGIQGQKFSIYKFAFWPHLKAKRLNISEMKSTGTWTLESDEIGGIREYSRTKGASKSLTIEASKLWVYGTPDPFHGKLRISFNTIDQIVNTAYTRKDGTLMFESEDIPTTFHQLDLVSVDSKPVLIYCVYYLYDPPEPTRMPFPSRSPIPDTNQNYINKEFIGVSIPQINIRPDLNADIKQISGCTFSNIICSNQYFIRLDKDILFYDNRIEFNTASYDNPAAIFFTQSLKTPMTISRCTFVNVVSRDNNDGNAVNIRGDLDVLIEDSRFVNCYGEGRDGQAVVQYNEKKQKQVTFTGCTFQFTTSTSSCHAFIGDNSKVIFDRCTFSKCGVAILVNEVTTFEFTNNIVTSAGQEIIKIDKLKVKPIITGNTFKFNQINGSNSITLIHDVNQIDITNNTFHSNSLIGKDNTVEGGGSGLYIKSINDSPNSLYITECFFTENQNNYASSDSSHGGALHLSSSPLTELIIKKCEFKDNKCTQGNGGAICATSSANIIIEECTFESNIASAEGNVLFITQDGTEVKLSISKCHFINNGDNNKKKTMISGSCVELVFETCEVKYSSATQSSQVFKLTSNGEVTLSNTEFDNCSSNTDSIVSFTQQKDDSTVTVSKCNFFNCKANRFTVQISKGKAIVSECTFTYIANNQNNACGSLQLNCNGVSCTFCEFTRAYISGLLDIAQVDNKDDEIIVSNCVFDDCAGDNTRCFKINTNTQSITFSNNVVKNMKSGGTDGYFGLINHNKDKVPSIEMKNITFKDNTCNAKYGGGSGLWITNFDTIIFNDCKFINNVAVKSANRDNNGYPAGDGGAIQYGYAKSISYANMKFENCLFSKNKAVRHGGAVALQITGTVDIVSCTFEENIANYKLPSSLELLANYYNQKSEGRGGAIYINPSFTVTGTDYNTKSVNIEKCTFKSNYAFDGFAIYIEGDAPVTTFTIKDNTFTNNHDNTDNSKNRGVIVTEVDKIMNDDIEGTNTFDLSPSYLRIHAIIFVDHSARTPESTPMATPKKVDYDESECNPGCHFIGDETPNLFIPPVSEFKDITNETKGGSAIHIENAGCTIVESKFENCKSPNDGGGAIYIDNEIQSVIHTITIENTYFTLCKAIYGGAVYVCSASESSPANIRNCVFDQNQALTRSDRSNDNLFGGSAVYLNVREGTVLNCTFTKNFGKGGAMKVLNEFENNYRSFLLQSMKNSVLVSDCLFEISNEQSCSIYYHGGKFGSNIELRDCIFSGELDKNAYHIDGKKEYDNSPRLNIINCMFASDIKSSLNIKGDFLSISLKDQVFNMNSAQQKDTSKPSYNLLYIVVGLAVTALLATISVVLILKKSNQTREEEEIVEESL